MGDGGASVKNKIERAEGHIHHLKAELDTFRGSDPYEALPYDEPNTGDRVVKLHVVRVPPARISLILGDAVHNLRSSLDHLAYQLILAGGGTPTRQSCFPLYPRATIPEFESMLKRVVQGASPKALDLIRAEQPYKGGKGVLLGQLHDLDSIDKHRLLVTVIATSTLVRQRIGPATVETFNTGQGSIKYTLSGPLEDGAELARHPAAQRTKDYNDPTFVFEVGFSDIVQGEPLIPVLTSLLSEAERLLNVFRPLLS